MKEKIIKNKKIILEYIILICLLSFAIAFVNNNYSFYDETIIKVTDIKITDSSVSTNSLGLEETYSTQNITGLIMNNQKKGQTIEIENEISTSSVVNETYKIGDEIFVDGKNITGLKRDKYVVFMIAMFIFSIFLVGQMKGLLSVVTVIVNMAIFYLGLNLYSSGTSLVLLCLGESFLFTIFSLFLTNGKHRKTLAAIISVFVSTLTLFILTLIIIKTTKYSGINFTGMEFLTIPAEEAFMAELVLGGLGAIMDVCVTISASFAELIEKDRNISTKSLVGSGKKIGNDIMGTMINVIFFTYLCSGLPVFVLALRNGFTLQNYISSNFTLEITRFLVGAIGIVLAIPISIYISTKIFKKEKIK